MSTVYMESTPPLKSTGYENKMKLATKPGGHASGRKSLSVRSGREEVPGCNEGPFANADIVEVINARSQTIHRETEFATRCPATENRGRNPSLQNLWTWAWSSVAYMPLFKPVAQINGKYTNLVPRIRKPDVGLGMSYDMHDRRRFLILRCSVKKRRDENRMRLTSATERCPAELWFISDMGSLAPLRLESPSSFPRPRRTVRKFNLIIGQWAVRQMENSQTSPTEY
ncbi:hypothetical protein C8R46DRAFT_1325199 [Mycena filopes]|nr:hypothetical protein C8R46DRAFT_1325199 [Mycena filopes]